MSKQSSRPGRLKWNPLRLQRTSPREAQSGNDWWPPFPEHLPPPSAIYEPKQPITIELKKLIEEHAYAGAFQSAIDTVRQQQVPELDRIQNLSQFYCYVDSLATWKPGLRHWEWQGAIYHERTDYLRITQFYYYFNQPQLVALQSPIEPYAGEELTPLSLWLREFAIEWGAFLDTPESAEYLESYKFGPEYTYQDFMDLEGNVGGNAKYGTFNEWFSRRFADIEEQRPVASPDDPRVVVFPAESTFVGQWAINTPVPASEPMPAESSIVVKNVEWPIPELLKDSAYRDDFEGGILVHSFLNVFDYHRQHVPAAGKVLEAKFIPGQVYLDVELLHLDDPAERHIVETEDSALANVVLDRKYLDAQDGTSYQFVQNRALFVLQTAIGKVAVLPMGMAHVSAVAFVKPGTQGRELIVPTGKEKELPYEEQVRLINERLEKEVVGTKVAKGEMISTFLFGGSDIVVVFERRAAVHICAQVGVHYPIRSQYAYANIAKLLEID